MERRIITLDGGPTIAGSIVLSIGSSMRVRSVQFMAHLVTAGPWVGTRTVEFIQVSIQPIFTTPDSGGINPGEIALISLVEDNVTTATQAQGYLQGGTGIVPCSFLVQAGMAVYVHSTTFALTGYVVLFLE